MANAMLKQRQDEKWCAFLLATDVVRNLEKHNVSWSKPTEEDKDEALANYTGADAAADHGERGNNVSAKRESWTRYLESHSKPGSNASLSVIERGSRRIGDLDKRYYGQSKHDDDKTDVFGGQEDHVFY